MRDKEPKRLCIDIDNVLAQSDVLMRNIIKDVTHSRVCLAYENITYFEYEKCKDDNGNQITKEEWHIVHDIFSEETNIMSIYPFPNIQSYLENLIISGYELHLVTSRLYKARIPTIKWILKNNFPDSHRLHFLKHREKHKVLNNFTAVIEDDLQQAVSFANNGIKAYVIAHPWNNYENLKNNIIRISNWDDLINIL